MKEYLRSEFEKKVRERGGRGEGGETYLHFAAYLREMLTPRKC